MSSSKSNSNDKRSDPNIDDDNVDNLTDANNESSSSSSNNSPPRPRHSSGPSMTFTLQPKQQQQQQSSSSTAGTTTTATTTATAAASTQKQLHNRNVTPHTASLMSLFARPVVTTTPTTPLTPPDYGSDAGPSSTSYYGAMAPAAAAPSLPEEDDEEDDDSIVSTDEVSSPNRKGSYFIHNDDLESYSTTPRNSNATTTATASTAATTTTTSTTTNDMIATSGEKLPLLTSNKKKGPVSFRRKATEKSHNMKTKLLDTTTNNNDDDEEDDNNNVDYYSHHNRDDTAVMDNLSSSSTSGYNGEQFHWVGTSYRQLSDIPSDGDGEEEEDGDDEMKKMFLPSLPNVSSTKPHQQQEQQQQKQQQYSRSSCSSMIYNLLSKMNLSTPQQIKSTLVGAFLFSLYQLVFIFAEASAISRPSHPPESSSILLSPIASMATFGSLISIPLLIGVLGGDYPALYPMLDMFMAPFLAKMAADIDEVLVREGGGGGGGSGNDDTDVFLATFVALNSFAMLLCALLCVLASHVKLANLALFLPYPVLCGFFSSVGVSLWMSSFKVDTGVPIQQFWGIEDRLFSFMKHIPSIISGTALYFLAPKSPLYLIGIVACTIVAAYSTMLVTGTSLHDAQTLGFFWKEEEVVMSPEAHRDYQTHLLFSSAFQKICWPAFKNGLPGVVALGLIYMIRCSLQAAALKKNLAVYLRQKAAAASATNNDTRSSFMVVNETKEDKPVSPKRKPKDVLQVLVSFAGALFATAVTGGFACVPSVGLSGTFINVGAELRAPQFASCILVLGCYLSDFRLISFVPKCAFSSLLVMAAIDLLYTNLIKSYQKTGSEWFVVPIIVLSGQAFGTLPSVAFGVAASTLMFVSSFYKAGTVKFIANGLTIRSTVERHADDNVWLDRNGDMIQILVLQNYLFFGNATSVLKYISSMFDDVDVVDDALLPPKPRYVVLDMSIVSGLDVSAVDCFADVTSLCKTEGCKLIIAGASRVVRPALIAGGVKPASHPHLSFVEDLEAALGSAEDGLLKFVACNEEKARKVGKKLKHLRQMSQFDIGLRLALKQIDEQHSLSFATYLQDLDEYTTAMDLQVGQQLDLPRGLYFVEYGLIKAEHDTSASLTRGRQRVYATPVMRNNTDSIGQLSARSATIGRGLNAIKALPGGTMSQFSHTFRLARVGPGWVIGCISEFTGQDIPGNFICMTESRVHYLPFETIQELEISKPVLIMHLYKLLAHLGARRQELTIGQLSTLRAVMSSTAPSKPISRKSMAALSVNFQP